MAEVTTSEVKHRGWSVAHAHSSPSLSAEVRDYDWSMPPAGGFHLVDQAVIDMAMTPRPVTRARLGRQGERWRPLGAVYMVPPDVNFEVSVPRFDVLRQTALNCLLSRAMLAEAGAPDSWSPAALSCCLDVATPQVRAHMRTIARELRAPGHASAAMIEAAGMLLTIELVRHLLGRTERETSRGGLPAWRLRLILDRIESSDLPPPLLTELAALVGLSERHLMRAFRTETGENLGGFIRAHCIDRAKSMLAGEQHSVKQVALALGFSSSASFCHAFRRDIGVRPGDFVRTWKAG